MQHKAADYFKENKYIFLMCSSTNLDSLWSFYKAAERNGMRFYSNGYVYNQLQNFKKHAGARAKNLYQFKSIYPVKWNKFLNKVKMTQEEFMREKGFVILIKEGERYKEWIERFADLNPKIIYSMWEGYIDPTMKAYNKELADFIKPYDPDRIYKLHTSGHATTKCIEDVIMAINPQKAIIPIHTENKAGFAYINISKELKQRTTYLNDGEEFVAQYK
jgi:ribonuclease J